MKVGMRQWFLGLGSKTCEELTAHRRESNPDWLDEEVVHWAESKVQVSPHVVQTFDQPEPPWRDALPRIACPILPITGDPAKGVVTPDDAQEMASLWRPGSRIQSVCKDGDGSLQGAARHPSHTSSFPTNRQGRRTSFSRS